MVQSTERTINKGFKIIKKALIEDIIKGLDDLNLQEKDKIKVSEYISNITEKPNKKKRSAPSVPLEKQCKSLCKTGEKCKVAICDKKLGKCWAHMKNDERIAYRASK